MCRLLLRRRKTTQVSDKSILNYGCQNIVYVRMTCFWQKRKCITDYVFLKKKTVWCKSLHIKVLLGRDYSEDKKGEMLQSSILIPG